MEHNDLQALLSRVDGLETRLVRLKRVLCVLVLGMIAVPLLAFATRTDEVKATKFSLVDTDGKTRAYWQTKADGGDPELIFLNPDDKKQIELSMSRSEALFAMRDEKELNRIGMAVAGYPHLMLHDEGQKPRMHLTVGKSGAPTILFIHKDGTFPGGLGVKVDGTPWLKPDRWNAFLDKQTEDDR